MRPEFGAFGPLSVRTERVRLGLSAPLRVLYSSDLHLGHWWTNRVPFHLLEVARTVRPDIHLLGGDLVTTRGRCPSWVVWSPRWWALLRFTPFPAITTSGWVWTASAKWCARRAEGG